MKKYNNFALIFLVVLFISACAHSESNSEALIKTEPMKIAEMEVSVNKDVECSYPDTKCLVGRITYTYPKDKPDTVRDFMIVVSKDLIDKNGFDFHKKSLKDIDLYLQNEKLIDTKANYDFWPVAFDDCGEYACNVVKEYTGIKFESADFVKTFVSREGQDIPGILVSRILVKKGDDYFLLAGDVSMEGSGIEKKCDPLMKDIAGENKAFIDCYVNEYQNNPVIISNTQKTFQRLINEFELK